MIPGLGVDLRVTLAQSKRDAPADVLSESVVAPASGHDGNASDGAAKPPRPVGITDDSHTRRCGFARPMVPTDSTDRVGSEP